MFSSERRVGAEWQEISCSDRHADYPIGQGHWLARKRFQLRIETLRDERAGAHPEKPSAVER
jgi:hypothetical protein